MIAAAPTDPFDCPYSTKTEYDSLAATLGHGIRVAASPAGTSVVSASRRFPSSAFIISISEEQPCRAPQPAAAPGDLQGGTFSGLAHWLRSIFSVSSRTLAELGRHCSSTLEKPGSMKGSSITLRRESKGTCESGAAGIERRFRLCGVHLCGDSSSAWTSGGGSSGGRCTVLTLAFDGGELHPATTIPPPNAPPKMILGFVR